MTDAPLIWRHNSTPRFTALEMGEYMAADDGPRETMLRDMRYERMARSLSYRTVGEAVAEFVASPTRNLRILLQCRDRLSEEKSQTTNARRRENLQHQIDALNAFERSLNALEISGLQISRAPIVRRPLQLEGVKISVQPSVHIRAAKPRGDDLVGALILDLAKGVAPKTPEAQARTTEAMTYAAVLLHRHVIDALITDGVKASPAHCVVFHVHRAERVCAPTNYMRMMRNVEAVCRTIARAWEHIEPPPRFDPASAEHRA